MSTTRDMIDTALMGIQPGEQTMPEPLATTAVKTETPVVTDSRTTNAAATKTTTSTGTDGTGGGGSATKVETPKPVVTPTPAKIVPMETPKPPSWQDLVDELQAVDEESEERKAEIRKKQRIAKGIAALGDFATHAINVWGASKGGYYAPIKGAPLTEAYDAREKEMLDEHAKKIEEYKKNIKAKYEGRSKDYATAVDAATKAVNNAYKEQSLAQKWAETKRKEEAAKIQNELRRLDLELKRMKLAFEKETNPQKKAKYQAEIDRIYAAIKYEQDRLALAEERLQFDRERQDDLNTYRDKYYGARNTQVFVVGDGDETLEVDKSLWEANWAQVFDILAKDPEYAKEAKRQKTSRAKKDFVRQYWWKSPEATQKMEQMTAGAVVTAPASQEAAQTVPQAEKQEKQEKSKTETKETKKDYSQYKRS